MSDDVSKGTSEIEILLADRQRLTDWLNRLAEADDAPAHVRKRVRADYEGRMAEVVSRLGGYRENISVSLEEERTRLEDAQSQRSEAEEERAEARLRHSVGEFGDDEWKRMDHEFGNRVAGHLEVIGELTAEINRLAEVLEQIAPAAPQGPAAVPVDDTDQEPRGAEPEPVTHKRYDQAGELAARGPEAPKFIPREGDPGGGRRSGRTLRFPSPAAAPDEGAGQVDEMTFIKSVALESPVEDAGARGRSTGKTLKCVDCGSMNRPTEWYCERCGAELAAL